MKDEQTRRPPPITLPRLFCAGAEAPPAIRPSPASKPPPIPVDAYHRRRSRAFWGSPAAEYPRYPVIIAGSTLPLAADVLVYLARDPAGAQTIAATANELYIPMSNRVWAGVSPVSPSADGRSGF